MDIRGHNENLEKIYKYQVVIFKMFGCWSLSAEESSERIRQIYELYYKHLLSFWVLLLDSALLIHVVRIITDIDEVLKIVFLLVTLLAFLVKYLTLKTKSKDFQILFRTLHMKKFELRNAREGNLLSKGLKIIERLRNVYIFNSIAALLAVMFTNAIAKSGSLPLDMYTPYSLERKWAFILTYAYQFLAISMACLINTGFDTLCPSMLVFVKSQLEILGDRLRNISAMTGDDDGKVSAELRFAMIFYEDILKLFKDIEELIRVPFSVQLMCSILVLMANFYAISVLSVENLLVGLPGLIAYQICMLMQIFMICYFANEVKLTSTKISHALYSADWMFWNKRNRRLALLMMECYSTPLRSKSINSNVSFDLEAFTAIVNSSYSYFALLKRINQ